MHEDELSVFCQNISPSLLEIMFWIGNLRELVLYSNISIWGEKIYKRNSNHRSVGVNKTIFVDSLIEWGE